MFFYTLYTSTYHVTRNTDRLTIAHVISAYYRPTSYLRVVYNTWTWVEITRARAVITSTLKHRPPLLLHGASSNIVYSEV